MPAFDRIRIILVETSHPGNIGAAARAMKTMGLSRLYLVAPKKFPCAAATERAAGADDVLYSATVCTSLPRALSGCTWATATSARPRHLRWPEVAPGSAAAALVAAAADADVALVFGRERSGLRNAELDLCRDVVRVPTCTGFSSLNLAAAVQILAYEIRGAALRGASPPPGGSDDPVTTEQIDGFYRHLESALVDIGYLDRARPKLLMRRLRRLFARAGVERAELNILRGILSAAQRCASNR